MNRCGQSLQGIAECGGASCTSLVYCRADKECSFLVVVMVLVDNRFPNEMGVWPDTKSLRVQEVVQT